MVEGASHFVFCHDDVAPEPDAIYQLVEESFRSNAGVVAPKLVSWDDPGRLLHVGMAVDKGGAVVDRVEPGEVDHGQHDAVRDVFLAPGGCTLVRADLFAELGGFDPDIFAMGEDLDLCWRAQIAGARVLVAPQARVRHLEVLASGQRRLPESVLVDIPLEERAVDHDEPADGEVAEVSASARGGRDGIGAAPAGAARPPPGEPAPSPRHAAVAATSSRAPCRTESLWTLPSASGAAPAAGAGLGRIRHRPGVGTPGPRRRRGPCVAVEPGPTPGHPHRAGGRPGPPAPRRRRGPTAPTPRQCPAQCLRPARREPGPQGGPPRRGQRRGRRRGGAARGRTGGG